MKLQIIPVFVTLLAGASVFAAVAYNGKHIENNKMEQAAIIIPKAPDVSVFEVQHADYQSMVTGFGAAQSHYQLDLTSEVSGQVDSLSASLETGKTIKESSLLVSLDDVKYKQALATAKADYASANLALLEEERRGQQAKLEWTQSGLKGQPDSPLVLRKPQLDFARATLEQAKNALATAKRNLSKTKIRAPFNAVVVSRQAQPGSYLQVGSPIASLYSTDNVEVMIPLSSSDWQLLPDLQNIDELEWPVTLHNIENHHQWQGKIGRIEQHMDNGSRQRVLVIIVDKPLEQKTPLYPGMFLRAEIPGKTINKLWRVPASAISQNGDIWLVDEDNTLHRYPVNKLFERGQYCYILPVNDQAKATIVLRPLSAYILGMRITPRVHKS